jgi:rhodanese-related sulfurtransferase
MQQYTNFFFHHIDLWIAFFVILALLLGLEIRNKLMGLKSISPQEAIHLMNRENAVVLDVRDAKQFAAGHIIGALNIPEAELNDKISHLERDKSLPVIVVFMLGQPTTKIAALLKSSGFTHVVSLRGGIANWQNAGLPLEK